MKIIRYSKPLSARYSLSCLIVMCPWILDEFTSSSREEQHRTYRVNPVRW